MSRHQPDRRRFRVPRCSSRVAFWLQISILVELLASSSVPTPLYSIYQARWGITPITITVVFAVYAFAVLSALLVVGKLSDHIGRRPVLFAALAVQLVALVVLVSASGMGMLTAGRVLQGLSTGSAVGAIGAALIDIDAARGTVANGVGPMTGTGSGALISGVAIQYLPAPTHLIYVALIGVVVIQLVGLTLVGETVTRKAGALAALKPELGIPARARRAFLAAVPALIAVWSIAGFDGSLGPSLARELAGSSSYVLGGLPLTFLASGAATSIFLTRNVEPQRTMRAGAILIGVGMGGALASIEAGSAVGFFIATVVAGLGFGGGFQGSIRTVVPLAHPHERAGTLSALYVVSYLAFGLPAIVAGVLVEHLGLLATARGYAAVVTVLAAAALIGSIRGREAPPAPGCGTSLTSREHGYGSPRGAPRAAGSHLRAGATDRPDRPQPRREGQHEGRAAGRGGRRLPARG
ncbi:MAG TPA: MFS transporter [Mycobacteriales bacterium]|nr:MFS transporter [Mycobacteriales bacterium]